MQKTPYFVNGTELSRLFHNTLPSFQHCTTGENCSMGEAVHPNL